MRAEEISPSVVEVQGRFGIPGLVIKVTKEAIVDATFNQVTGNNVTGRGRAIVYGPNGFVVG